MWENIFEGIRGLKYIFVTLFVLFWIFYAIPTILLRIPYIQRQITEKVAGGLSEHLGVAVRIGKVDIEWINRLVLDGLYLEDQSGEVLFEANHVAAGFEFFPLLQGKFVFHTARIFGFTLSLTKDTPEEDLNLQFLIDAFASNDSLKKETNIDLQFHSILIRRGEFSYHVLSETPTPGKFNANHIAVHNLSGNISLKAFNKDTLNAHIKKLSFEEESGIELKKLSMNVVGNRQGSMIRNFDLRLPNTHLSIPDVNIDYTGVDSVEQVADIAPVNLTIAPSYISLKDLSAFVPAFVNFTDTIDFSAEATGFINDIDLKRLTLSYSDKMLFNGKMNLRGITNPEEAYLFGEVSRMYITNEGLLGLVNNFQETPIDLPAPIRNLGSINFTGEISGFFDNLVAYGKLNTAIGSLQTDVLFGSNKDKNIAGYVRGHVVSSELEIAELLPEDNPYGSLSLDIQLDASRPVGGTFAGNVNGEIGMFDFREYRYENILLSGHFSHNSFNGRVEVDDPNGYLLAEGFFRNQGKNSVFNFTADLKHFRPDLLNLTDKYESPDISVSLVADFTGNTIDNVEGSILIDSLIFLTEPAGFEVNHLEVKAVGTNEDRRLSITSDLINGELKGAYSFTTFIPSILNTIEEYIPALIHTKTTRQNFGENNFTYLLTIENTDDIIRTLKLPVSVLKQTQISGHYSNVNESFNLEARIPAFRVNNMMFENGFVSFENPHGLAELEVRAINYNAKGLRNYIDLKADARDNRINTFLSWANNKEKLFKADIAASALFIAERDEKGKADLRTEIILHESPFVINDSIWHINEALINIEDKSVEVHNFLVSHNKQYLRIDGAVSDDADDLLLLELNDIELSYIFDVLNIPALQFAGQATGIFHVSDLYNSRKLDTDLVVENFSFNRTDLGRLNLYSEWDDDQQGILMLGSIYKNDSTWTDVNGYIYPVGSHQGLALNFDANDINVAFLQPFMDNVAKNVQGHGFGYVSLYGPFNELSLDGRAYVENGGIGIEFLDTYYTFSDSIFLYPGSFQASDFKVRDKYGNEGTVNLMVKHKHFKEIEYDVNVYANNMLVYDASERHNPEIYGTVYASGTARISGNEKLVNLDVNMRSEPKTSVSLNFMGSSKAAEYDFITFIDKSVQTADTLQTDSIYRPYLWKEEGAEIVMNFLLDVTPEANIELIMDAAAGDKIRGFGSGSMQIEWGTKTDLRMYGSYYILNGNYNFSLQQLIHKNFRIREGSSITFRGDPFNALLNIDAVYNLTANIGDLDQSFARESARTNVPVNCVLKIDGMLQNPTLSFDIELPGSNEDLVQKVKSFVNTEDMMTRQIVYLLVLNKFYTVDPTNSSNEFGAMANAALSYQLSSILNSITDKVQIGTNIRTNQDGISETEVEVLLSSQLLNNRLIFNGNFGYRNQIEQGNIFVGEFDIEYMLTRSGEIRLKAYNHANDMYRYLKQSLTTQGIGIMYRKDFTHISEIFRRRKRVLLPPAGTHWVIPEEEELEPVNREEPER